MTLEQSVESKQKPSKAQIAMNISFCLLPDVHINTIPKIASHLGVSEPEVEVIVQSLIKADKVLEQDGRFFLRPDFEAAVSQFKDLQLSQEKALRFDKYTNNPVFETEIHHEPSFDVAKSEETAGKFLFKRFISPQEIAYCFERKVFMVWDEGVRKGEAFFSFDKVEENEVGEVVSPNDFLTELRTRFEAIGQNPKEKATRCREVLEYVFSVVNGANGKLGWEKLRFYDLDGNGDKINQLLQQILIQRLDVFLTELAKKSGLEVGHFDFAIDETFQLKTYYDLEITQKYNNVWIQEADPIMLTHATYSNVLPNIIQLGGLAAKDHYEKFGIQKYYGGENGGKNPYDPDKVSFSLNESDFIVHGGWGPQRAFEFPIQLGITKTNAEQLRLRPGTDLQSEVTVSPFVPLRFVTHIFVPEFKIEEVRAMLDQNGITQIKVLSLNQRGVVQQDHQIYIEK